MAKSHPSEKSFLLSLGWEEHRVLEYTWDRGACEPQTGTWSEQSRLHHALSSPVRIWIYPWRALLQQEMLAQPPSQLSGSWVVRGMLPQNWGSLGLCVTRDKADGHLCLTARDLVLVNSTGGFLPAGSSLLGEMLPATRLCGLSPSCTRLTHVQDCSGRERKQLP